MTGATLFDPGLQPERTDLAWRRTVLAVAVGALVSLRLLPPVLGAWSLAVGLVGLLLAGASWVLARRRARLVRAALLHTSASLPGAGLLLIHATITASAAILALVYVILS